MLLNCAAEIKIEPDIQDLADVSSEGGWLGGRRETMRKMAFTSSWLEMFCLELL